MVDCTLAMVDCTLAMRDCTLRLNQNKALHPEVVFIVAIRQLIQKKIDPSLEPPKEANLSAGYGLQSSDLQGLYWAKLSPLRYLLCCKRNEHNNMADGICTKFLS